MNLTTLWWNLIPPSWALTLTHTRRVTIKCFKIYSINFLSLAFGILLLRQSRSRTFNVKSFLIFFNGFPYLLKSHNDACQQRLESLAFDIFLMSKVSICVYYDHYIYWNDVLSNTSYTLLSYSSYVYPITLIITMFESIFCMVFYASIFWYKLNEILFIFYLHTNKNYIMVLVDSKNYEI